MGTPSEKPKGLGLGVDAAFYTLHPEAVNVFLERMMEGRKSEAGGSMAHLERPIRLVLSWRLCEGSIFI